MPVSIFGKFQMVNVFQSANPTCMRYLFRIVDNTGVVYYSCLAFFAEILLVWLLSWHTKLKLTCMQEDQ